MNANFVREYNDIVLNDTGRKIKITKEIIKVLNKYRQVNKELEAGGILIGREDKSNGNLIIEYATYPMEKDIRKRDRFYRKDEGHINYYNKIYEENNGIYAYVGEWHTHPEKEPTPSIIDKNNWKKILNRKGEGELFNIIVGIEKIRIWKCHNRNEIELVEEKEVK